MIIFYIFATFFLILGGIAWIFSPKVTWWEWLISASFAFIVAGIFQWCLFFSMTHDVQTKSGQITKSKQFSAWTEYYEYAVYRTEYHTSTDSKGHTTTYSTQVFDHWQPTTRFHDAYWKCYSNIGTEYNIDKTHYVNETIWFGDEHPVPGERTTFEHNSYMISGDPNDYVAIDKTGFVEPVTKITEFTNRLKCCPSVFSYVQPPEGKVYNYPENNDPFHSDRLIGIPKGQIDLTPDKLDKVNSKIGYIKHANLIIVDFGDKDDSYGKMQESKWIGGKKNDIVITFGGNYLHPEWCYVFGWTEKNIVKQTIEQIVLEKGLTDSSLDDIQQEIFKDYVIKDWKKFDYLQVEPPTWSYLVYFFSVLVVQGFFWYS